MITPVVIAKRTSVTIKGSAIAHTFKLERIETQGGVPNGEQLFCVQAVISTLLRTLSIGQNFSEISVELSGTTKPSEDRISSVTPPKPKEKKSQSTTEKRPHGSSKKDSTAKLVLSNW